MLFVTTEQNRVTLTEVILNLFETLKLRVCGEISSLIFRLLKFKK